MCFRSKHGDQSSGKLKRYINNLEENFSTNKINLNYRIDLELYSFEKIIVKVQRSEKQNQKQK